MQMDHTMRKLLHAVACQLGVDEKELKPETRIVADLGVDSLDLVELVMAVEETFEIRLPDPVDSPNDIYSGIFTNPDFCIADFVDLLSIRREVEARKSGKPFWSSVVSSMRPSFAAFTQRGEPGSFSREKNNARLSGKNDAGFHQYRRKSDGMLQIEIPAATVELAGEDEYLESFLMDVEPVSTTAYSGFLNATCPDEATLSTWITEGEKQRRAIHQPLHFQDGEWRPVPGAETWPMMLVSWYGANAYALWANGKNWTKYREESPFLPSLHQFTYAARGADRKAYPWGDRAPLANDAVFARLQFGREYALKDIPLAPVNSEIAVSPFGLRHVVGNIWHWCRDWLDAERKIRAERGGSWIGPGDLMHCDFRRGRIPSATGRCLGFRCVSPTDN